MNPAIPPASLPGFGRSLAIIIGINAYSNGVPPLLNAVRDATTVAEALDRQGFEVLSLLDSQASLSALSLLLTHQLPALQPPLDRLLIYFAGHGLARTDEQNHFSGFLLPADARRDDPSSYWPMAFLRQALLHLPCRHLLLILDCCFAGAFPQESFRDLRPAQPHTPLFLERFRHFSSRRSFQLLLSASHDELASDKLLAKPSQETLGSELHSPFALALLEALQPSSPSDSNQDGLLTASELYTFLRDRLLALLPAHTQQTPSLRQMDWHDGGEFLFLLSGAFPSLPSAAPLSKHSNPYLGLRPFTSEDRHLFFGRERLVDSLLQRLISQPLLLLCGSSGSGKSSLVHAGLIPRFTDQPDWLVPPPPLRPSSQPLQKLSSWLASVSPDAPAPSPEALARQPLLAAQSLNSFLSLHPLRSVILVVDPLEELITACEDDSLRVLFMHALSRILHLAHPRLRLILLLRSDFEPHFLPLIAPHQIFIERWSESRFVLPPMNRDELRRCLQKPAEASVLFFSPGVVERVLDDIEQMPGALPLLSVALSELFNAYIDSGREDRTLSLEDYERLGGGIAGALQRRAELIFSGDPAPASDNQPPLPSVPLEELLDVQRTLRNVLLRMVSTEGSELARRRVLRDELVFPLPEENARAQYVLSALESCRLVVATDDGGPCVEPAHDALLLAWPRLREWARQAQRELLLLRRISHAASEWLRHRDPILLWADARLDALDLPPVTLQRKEGLIALPVSLPNGLPAKPLIFNASESSFLRASAARQRSLRTKRYSMALVMAIALIGLAVAALIQPDRMGAPSSETRHAKEQSPGLKQRDRLLANAQFSHAQQLLEHDPTKALLILREISLMHEEAPSSWLQLVLELNRRVISTAILGSLSSQVKSAVFSPDGRLVLVAADQSAWIWRADGQGTPIILEGHHNSVNSAIFSADGLRVLTTSEDGTARIWRADGQGTPIILKGHAQSVSTATFSPDGSRVLTASEDGTARIWRADGQGTAIILKGHRNSVNSAIFSADGLRVLTTSEDGTARIWRADGQGAPIILEGHTNRVNSATFSPDGSRVLTSSWDCTARIWQVGGQGSPIILQGHTKAVNTATFSPDGQSVLTASDDGTARIWRADGQGTPIILEGHTHWVNSAAFSPDGSRVLTASNDGTARIWRADGQGTPTVLQGHTGRVFSGTFSLDGVHVVTASLDRTVRVWRTSAQESPVVLEEHDWRANSFTIDAESNYSSVLMTSDEDIALGCSMNDRLPLVMLKEPMSRISLAGFSPDGSRVFTVSDSNAVRIWRADGVGPPMVLQGPVGPMSACGFSPDGSRLIMSSFDGSVRLWRIDGQGSPVTLKGHEGPVNHASFSPDGLRVITAGADGTARIWRTDGWGYPVILRGHEDEVVFVGFNPDGSRVITASSDGTARIWRADGHGSPVILQGHEGGVHAAFFSPDGSLVLTTSTDNTSRIWRVDSQASPIILPDHGFWSSGVIFSPDSSRVLTTFDDLVFIRRIDEPNTPIVLRGHDGRVISASFSPDGSRVLSLSTDGTARVWSIGNQDAPIILQERMSMISSADFDTDGARVLTTSSDGISRIWSTNTQAVSSAHKPRSSWRILCLPISSDESFARAANKVDTVRIWDDDNRQNPIVIRGLATDIVSVTLSSRSSRIIVESSSGKTIIVVTPALLREFLWSAKTSACLSPRDRMDYLYESLGKALEEHARCVDEFLRDPIP
jgi:WD40 repeat protein